MTTARYLLATYAYGTVRNLVLAPWLKPDEYVTDRFGRFAAITVLTPFLLPAFLYLDAKNIEHLVRKMPGPIDRSPW
jgi:hypothetical protein